VYLEEDNVPILEPGRMKTKDKMCNLEKLGQNQWRILTKSVGGAKVI